MTKRIALVVAAVLGMSSGCATFNTRPHADPNCWYAANGAVKCYSVTLENSMQRKVR